MPRPLFDSESIFGCQEPGGDAYMLEAGRPGWITFSETVGHNPEDHNGVDYSAYSERGLGVICRINNGYEPEGTLPHSSLYESFARRVANFVATSRGCKIWVIGNEVNYAVERSGIHIDWTRHNSRRDGPPEVADPTRRGLPVRFNILPEQSTEIRTTRGAIISPGEIITPELYVRAYRLCRDAIHRLPGHANDQVLVGAVAPWNTQTIYSGNPNGDWVLYFRHVLELLGPENCDGFTIHAYTHSADPALISSPAKLPPPFQNYHVHFRVYSDFMNAVPLSMRHLPAYITEAGQSQPWADRNDGWIQRAYAEIDTWNRNQANVSHHQKIRALILYRWPRIDKWYIEGKAGVEEDFRLALHNDYRWDVERPASPAKSEGWNPFQSTERGRARPAEREPGREPIARGEQEARKQEPARASETPLTSGARRSDPQRTKAFPPEAIHAQGNPQGKAQGKAPSPEPTVDYQAEWVDAEFPPKLMAGETIIVPITVRNLGGLTWTPRSGNPVRIGYHYYRSRKQLPLTPQQDVRTDLPHDVAPGETITVGVRIALPDQPGNYTLEVDLVQEGVLWFKEKKSPTLSRWLTVETLSPGPAASLASPSTPATAGKTLHLPVPLFLDVSASLPRSPSPYARRNPNQIRHIVISHTGANPALSLERLANVHIGVGYPGIAYDFVVDGVGQIYRVKEMEYAAQPDQAWSEQGVNVCVAGHFGTEPPTIIQLDAVGRLCAWLAQNLGLSADAIIGLGELTRGDNPGATFYRGPTWKTMITRQVQLHLAALGLGALDTSRVDELQSQVSRLQAEKQQMRQQLDAALSEHEKLQHFNERLQSQLVARQREVDALRSDTSGIRLQIEDLSLDLPRDASRYRPRNPARVEYLVIQHTGVTAETPLRQLVDAHRKEWPGLLFDYVIYPDGRIVQTQPLDQAIASSEAYLSEGIGIAFAGTFEKDLPTNEQIFAGGQLIAWLMQRYPHLATGDLPGEIVGTITERVKGLSELAASSTSPGAQWLTGKRWKDRLLAAVRRASGLVEPTEIEQSLQVQIESLEEHLEHSQRTLHSLQEVRHNLESDNQQLQLELAQRSQPVQASFVVPKPAIQSVVEQLPRHPSLRYERRALSQISHLAIHHTAAPPTLTLARIAELHIAADPVRGKDAWPGIAYHYLIQSDGSIEQTNGLEIASFHVHRHYLYSVGICFAGSFMNGKIPTSTQLRAGAHLVAWLMQELNIPLARVWGHRDFPENVTVCPGSEWTQGNRWRDLLFERIEQVQRGAAIKPIRHYLLLWQRPYPGPMARQDLVNATGYLARFRPTLGFNPEDAMQSEYVTILGNEAGIDTATEQKLLEAGCKVERIAGRDEEETLRILAELTRSGQRFVKFEADF